MKIEVWEGKRGYWYWHFKASNGRVTADSEGFISKGHAMRAAKAVVRGVVNLFPGKPVYFTAKPKEGKIIIRWS